MTARTLALLLLAGALPLPSLSAANDLVPELEGDLSAGRLRECARRANVPDAPPRASYLGGLCLLGLNNRDGAEPLLKRAQDGNFWPTASWRKPPNELLAQIAAYRRLAPEFAKVDGVPETSMRIAYDARSPWVDGRRSLEGSAVTLHTSYNRFSS